MLKSKFSLLIINDVKTIIAICESKFLILATFLGVIFSETTSISNFSHFCLTVFHPKSVV